MSIRGSNDDSGAIALLEERDLYCDEKLHDWVDDDDGFVSSNNGLIPHIMDHMSEMGCGIVDLYDPSGQKPINI